MQELTVANCEYVSGGVLPLLVAGVIGVSTILGNAGSVYDFISGALDGYSGIQ